MATKTDTKKQRGTASNKAEASAASSQKHGASNSQFDFTSFSKSFMTPQQFFNLSTFSGFEPSDWQSLFQRTIATGQKNLEVLTACTQMYATRTKDILEEHVALGSELFQETSNTWQDSFKGTRTDPHARLDSMNAFAKYCVDRSAKVARKTTDETLQICQELGNQWNKHLTATVEEMRFAA